MIDLKKIGIGERVDIVNPSAIFSALPNKHEKYKGYLRDVQGEVLNKWFEIRDNKDNIIKMNTGSGKTTVSLLILQSCLNEKKGNAVYVVPDNYLIKQVKKEANDLGIAVVEDEKDIDFKRKKAILVISIQKLVNGRTVFDQRNPIDNIIIDDVHACLDIMEQQFTIRIERGKYSKLYMTIVDMFYGEIFRQNKSAALDFREKEFSDSIMLIPFWEVGKKDVDLLETLRGYKDNPDLGFPLSFLEDLLKYCNISVSSRCIEISPDSLPIHKVSSLCLASRRIFVSATLKDDSRLLKCFDINPDDIPEIITPKRALDIGNRMILYPQALNTEINDNDIKAYMKKLSNDYRVIVIVPSYQRAKFWEDVSDHLFDKTNIEDIVNYNCGLDVLVNRYDGIDLKDDLCRYLVIDGMPLAKSLFESIEESILRDTSKSASSKIQKVEQGMGRGIRSNTDNCAVVIMGKRMLDILYNNGAKDSFSVSTRVQYDLSESISEQLRNCSLESIMETFELCLKRDEEWITILNSNLSQKINTTELKYDLSEIKLSKALRCAYNGDYRSCTSMIQELVNAETDIRIKGYYMYYLAKYTNYYDVVEAQKILLSAKKLNVDLCLPLECAAFNGRKLVCTSQVNNLISKMALEFNNDPQRLLFKYENIFSDLTFESPYKLFEKALCDLGNYLGFVSSRPELELSVGPDVFFDVGGNSCYVIECKNEATTDFICKDDCSQLLNSVQWAKDVYDGENEIIPIMVHKSNIFDVSAYPEKNCRVINEECIKKLQTQVRGFANSLCLNGEYNYNLIVEGLQKYDLLKNDFIRTYTIPYEKKQ